MWPDVETKNSTTLTQISHSSFWLKVLFGKTAQNGKNYLGYFCKQTKCFQIFQKSSNGHAASQQCDQSGDLLDFGPLFKACGNN